MNKPIDKNKSFLKESITDELEIIDLFRILFKSKEKLWIWQENKENPSQRAIHLCMIRKVDVISKLIWISPLNQSKFQFNSEGSDFFLYSKIRNLAISFKSREKDIEFISFTTPKKVNALSDDFSEKINLIEKENEQMHGHLRVAPRKQAKGKQTIRALRQGESQPQLYNLYDISAGGLAIKWEDPGYFKKGDLITILSINDSKLGSPITGEVVSVREMPEDEIFKIGVMFVQKD